MRLNPRAMGLFLILAATGFLFQCATKEQVLSDQERWDTKADGERKAKMKPDELAWENTLEKSLDPVMLAAYKNIKVKGEDSPFDFVRDDPRLPRLLLVGDRLSLDFTTELRKKLSRVANVHRIPDDGGSSKKGAKDIRKWLGDENWDIVVFNFGISDHDTPPYQYALNLRQIVRVLKYTQAQLVWAATPPLEPRSVGLKLNEVADKTMQANGIPKIDLYSAILPTYMEDRRGDGPFYDSDGVDVLTDKIADFVRAHVKRRR